MKKTTLFCASGIVLFLLLNAGVQYAKYHMSYSFIVKEGDISLINDIDVSMYLDNYGWQLYLNDGALSYTQLRTNNIEELPYFDVNMELEIDDDTEQSLPYYEVDTSSGLYSYHSEYEMTCQSLRADLDEAALTARIFSNYRFDHNVVIKDNGLKTKLRMVSKNDNQLYSFKTICNDGLDDDRSYDIRNELGVYGDIIEHINEDKTFFYMPRINDTMKGTASIYQLQLQESELDPNIYYVGSNDTEYCDLVVLNQYEFPVNLDTEAQFIHVNDKLYLFMANNTQATLTILNEDLKVLDTIPLEFTMEDMKHMELTYDQDHLIIRVENQIEIYDLNGKKVLQADIASLKQTVLDIRYQDGKIYLIGADQLDIPYSYQALNPNLYVIQNDRVTFHGVLYFHDDTPIRNEESIYDINWYDVKFVR